MRRVLVVANRTLVGERLSEEVRRRAAEPGGCAFHLVVPAQAVRGHLWTEGENALAAQRRLEEGLAHFRAAGITELSGEVGDRNPVSAVADALRHDAAFDEVLLSTLPPGPSRWIAMDLPHKVSRLTEITVTHIVSELPVGVPS